MMYSTCFFILFQKQAGSMAIRARARGGGFSLDVAAGADIGPRIPHPAAQRLTSADTGVQRRCDL